VIVADERDRVLQAVRRLPIAYRQRAGKAARAPSCVKITAG